MFLSKIMGWGSKYRKNLLIVFNGLFMIFGVVLIATACMDLHMIQSIPIVIMKSADYETDAVLIAVGVLIILVAAFGCFAVWRESPKLLYIFAGCFSVIIVLELLAGVTAAVLRPQIEEFLTSNLRGSFIKNKSAKTENSKYKDFWDLLQSELQCCGVRGPEDYWDYSLSVLHLPLSCCPPEYSEKSDYDKRFECISNREIYNEGCDVKLLRMIHTTGLHVIVCGILFSFLEVAGVGLALWLAHGIKTQGKGQESL